MNNEEIKKGISETPEQNLGSQNESGAKNEKFNSIKTLMQNLNNFRRTKECCEDDISTTEPPEGKGTLTIMSEDDLKKHGKQLPTDGCVFWEADAKMVSTLVTCGRMSPNQPNSEGKSILAVAAACGHRNLVNCLLENGALVDYHGKREKFSPLIEAIAYGHLTIVEALIKYGADVNMKTSNDSTPLHFACANNYSEIAEILISSGSPTNEINDRGSTPLMEAAACGSVDCVRTILKHDPHAFVLPVNSNDPQSKPFKDTALTIACYKGHFELVKLLLKIRKDSKSLTSEELYGGLVEASVDGHLEVIKLLIEFGAGVNSVPPFTESPLGFAANGGHLNLVRYLIDKGANINYQNEEGITALMEAAREGHYEVVIELLKRGSDVNITIKETNESALSMAAASGSEKILLALIDAGLKFHLYLNMALLDAAIFNHLNIVKLLISLGASSDFEAPITKASPLSCACESGNLDIVRLLVENGADLNRVGQDYLTPLMRASKNGHLTAVKLLISSGAEIDKYHPESDKTALSFACLYGHLEVARVLIEAGANPHICSKENITPLMYACTGGYLNIANLLLEKVDPKAETLKNYKPQEINGNHSEKFTSRTQNQTLCLKQNLAISQKQVKNLKLQVFKKTKESLLNDKISGNECVMKKKSGVFSKNKNNSNISNDKKQASQSFGINTVSDLSQESALTIATLNGHLEIVFLLINRGANVNHRDRHGNTPLIIATRKGFFNIVQVLLKGGSLLEMKCDKTHETALTIACTGNELEIVKELIKYGANIEHRPTNDLTPLLIACKNNYIKIASVLLDNGADPNVHAQGFTPLMFAASNGSTELARILIEHSANPSFEHMRNTALTLACHNKHTEIVSLILEKKINLEQRNKEGNTILMESVLAGNFSIISLLIKAGSDVNTTSAPSTRDTPLIIAAEKGKYEIVELLLKNKANVELKNKKGYTAFWIAASNGHLGTVKLLESFGASVDTVNLRDVSALVIALKRGHVDVIKFLAEKVKRFPSDNEFKKLNLVSSNDKNLDNRFSDCISVIMEAKAKQEVEAQRAASDLIKMESEEREKKNATSKKREKKKKRKNKIPEIKQDQILPKIEEIAPPKIPESPKINKIPKPQPKPKPQIEAILSPEQVVEHSDGEELRHVRRRSNITRFDVNKRVVRTQIPSHLVSRFIGKNGAFVNGLRVKTSTQIDIDTTKKSPLGDCSITIKGQFKDINCILCLISAVIAEPDRMNSNTLNELENICKNYDPVSFTNVVIPPQRASYPSSLPVQRNFPSSAHVSFESSMNSTTDQIGLMTSFKIEDHHKENDGLKIPTSNNFRLPSVIESDKSVQTQLHSQVSFPTKQTSGTCDLCPGSGRPLPTTQPTYSLDFNKNTFESLYSEKHKSGIRFDKNLWMKTSQEIDANSKSDIDAAIAIMDSVPPLNTVDEFTLWLQTLKISDNR